MSVASNWLGRLFTVPNLLFQHVPGNRRGELDCDPRPNGAFVIGGVVAGAASPFLLAFAMLPGSIVGILAVLLRKGLNLGVYLFALEQPWMVAVATSSCGAPLICSAHM